MSRKRCVRLCLYVLPHPCEERPQAQRLHRAAAQGKVRRSPGQVSLLLGVQSGGPFLPPRRIPQTQVTGTFLPKRGKAEDHPGGLDWHLRGSLARVQLGRALRRLNPYLRWLSGVPFTSAELWHFTLREDVAPFSSFVSCSYSRSTGRLRLRSRYALFETRRPVHLLLLTVHLPF